MPSVLEAWSLYFKQNFHCFQRASGSNPHSVWGVNARQRYPSFYGTSFRLFGLFSHLENRIGLHESLMPLPAVEKIQRFNITVSRSFCGFLHYFFGQTGCLASHSPQYEYMPWSTSQAPKDFLPFPLKCGSESSPLESNWLKNLKDYSLHMVFLLKP